MESTTSPLDHEKSSVQLDEQPPAYNFALQEFKSDDIPPSYDGSPPFVWAPQAQSSNNIIVCNSQPSPVIATTVIHKSMSCGFLRLSIVMTILAFLCFNWLSLICTIPAIVFAIMARDSDARGDFHKARTQGYISLAFNLAAIMAYAIVVGIILGLAYSGHLQ